MRPATALDAKVRSGPEALHFPGQLRTPGANPPPLFRRTLAAAGADLAIEANDPALARQLQDQGALYRQGQPFHQAPGY